MQFFLITLYVELKKNLVPHHPGISTNKSTYFATAAVILCSTSSMPYITETIHPSYHQNLAALPRISIASGIFLVWIIGSIFTWRVIAFLLILPPLFQTVFIFFLPWNPCGLIKQGNLDKATKSIQLFRGQKYDVSNEIIDTMLKRNLQKQFSCYSFKVQPKVLAASS